MLQRMIAALNTISSPILAVVIIILGCVFAVVSKFYGIDGNMAAGIIGAGIGLLTGQVLAASHSSSSSTPTTVITATEQTTEKGN